MLVFRGVDIEMIHGGTFRSVGFVRISRFILQNAWLELRIDFNNFLEIVGSPVILPFSWLSCGGFFMHLVICLPSQP